MCLHCILEEDAAKDKMAKAVTVEYPPMELPPMFKTIDMYRKENERLNLIVKQVTNRLIDAEKRLRMREQEIRLIQKIIERYRAS